MGSHGPRAHHPGFLGSGRSERDFDPSRERSHLSSARDPCSPNIVGGSLPTSVGEFTVCGMLGKGYLLTSSTLVSLFGVGPFHSGKQKRLDFV